MKRTLLPLLFLGLAGCWITDLSETIDALNFIPLYSERSVPVKVIDADMNRRSGATIKAGCLILAFEPRDRTSRFYLPASVMSRVDDIADVQRASFFHGTDPRYEVLIEVPDSCLRLPPLGSGDDLVPLKLNPEWTIVVAAARGRGLDDLTPDPFRGAPEILDNRRLAKESGFDTNDSATVIMREFVTKLLAPASSHDYFSSGHELYFMLSDTKQKMIERQIGEPASLSFWRGGREIASLIRDDMSLNEVSAVAPDSVSVRCNLTAVRRFRCTVREIENSDGPPGSLGILYDAGRWTIEY